MIDFRASLQILYRTGLAIVDAEISHFEQISDGWENEVYTFTLNAANQQQALILRIYPGNDAVEKSTREFQGMQKLHEVGYPVPKVLHHILDSAWFGKQFVIMEKINGQALSVVMQNSSPAQQQAWFTRVVQLFVDLHQLDFQPFIPPDAAKENWQDPFLFLRQTLALWQQMSAAFPEFAPVLDWLLAHLDAVPCPRYSPLHLDYHGENILITADEKLYIIDWCNLTAGDFRLDLAWSMLLASTYGNPSMRDRFLAEYQRLLGQPIVQIEFFEAMAAARRLFTVIFSIRQGAENLGMRPEAVQMMKQQISHIEQVYAVLKNRTHLALPQIEDFMQSLRVG